MAEQEQIQVISGSYERLLYGFNLSTNTSKLSPSFIYPSHISCIKTLAASKKFLASGSTDEHIKLYDLSAKKEIGSLLLQHEGSINHLAFYSNTHLFSCSDDGNICIYRARDWERLKVLSGHKGAVNWFDVHPGGQIALSVGKDQTLRCWDLAKGLCARSSKTTKGVGERVAWSPDGLFYAILFGTLIEISEVATGHVIGKIMKKQRMNSFVFTTLGGKQVIIAGGEDCEIGIWNTDGTSVTSFPSNHGSRIKDLDCYSTTEKAYLTTCSSDGGIKVWDLSTNELLAEYNTKCRLTCIRFAHPVKGKDRPVEKEKIEAVQSDYEYEKTIAKKNKVVVVEVDDQEKLTLDKVDKKNNLNKLVKKKKVFKKKNVGNAFERKPKVGGKKRKNDNAGTSEKKKVKTNTSDTTKKL